MHSSPLMALLGDLLHLLPVVILLAKLWRTRSCSGISGKSQILYAFVFSAQVLDVYGTSSLGSNPPWMRVSLVLASYLIIFLIYGPYRKTYDRDQDVLFNEFLVLPCFVLALFATEGSSSPEHVLLAFAALLEIVAIVPQLELLCGVQSVDNYVVSYLVSLGLYRTVFILTWALQAREFVALPIVVSFVQILLFVVAFLRVFSLKQSKEKVPYDVVE
ncbi:ER lumen protein-retaining receptor 1-like [Culex quinquefasciatus]|uniref:ER lumen protein-retaining receptor 1-B n=1 Tax=Culex pipiens TaxID=7175 RepID=A0A8D8F7H8_CULPI|nr:ER lumen protein-retaining receptor 1-like [Culex quinquefasciatus]